MSKVTVYSTTWCGFCHQLKTWLKGLDVEFDEIDIEENTDAGREVVEATKQMGVPVTKVGEKYIVGFDRPNLEEALKNEKLI
ncbi:MAG: glutaredoxin family protein [Candidatus Nomurabacteria bacterium]|nr:MAG: glutaredoxin family protein [Candidatus Nomurabacteria bacterium]HRV76390.1 glutaredoxin domain-containing protein [Candidatus Saccharimonadales bacterium]